MVYWRRILVVSYVPMVVRRWMVRWMGMGRIRVLWMMVRGRLYTESHGRMVWMSAIEV